jgi:hypothetical protein
MEKKLAYKAPPESRNRLAPVSTSRTYSEHSIPDDVWECIKNKNPDQIISMMNFLKDKGKENNMRVNTEKEAQELIYKGAPAREYDDIAYAHGFIAGIANMKPLQDQLGKILLELKVYGSLRDGRFNNAEKALKNSGYTCYEFPK